MSNDDRMTEGLHIEPDPANNKVILRMVVGGCSLFGTYDRKGIKLIIRYLKAARLALKENSDE